MKIRILGNSGSGKTTLARRLGGWQRVPLMELDGYVWAASDTPTQRPDAAIRDDVNRFIANHKSWIVEGCYAKWAEFTLAYAPTLVFLDLPMESCLDHCRARPWQVEKFASKSAQDRTLPFLLDWVRAYYMRDDDSSRVQHLRVFEQYGGPKHRIIDPALAVRWNLGDSV
jgi:adenylate kinase family enzyme